MVEDSIVILHLCMCFASIVTVACKRRTGKPPFCLSGCLLKACAASRQFQAHGHPLCRQASSLALEDHDNKQQQQQPRWIDNAFNINENN